MVLGPGLIGNPRASMFRAVAVWLPEHGMYTVVERTPVPYRRAFFATAAPS